MTNEKLAEHLQGRTISGTSNSGGTMIVSFTDGSELTVETGETGSNSASSGGTIKTVHQTEEKLTLDFEAGGSMEIPLAYGEDSVSVSGGKKPESTH